MQYGILKSSSNTGSDDEILIGFAAPLNIYSNQPEYIQDGLSLSRSASSQNVQRWEIEANLMPANSNANSLIHSVANGRSSIFYVRMPQIPGVVTTEGAITCGNVNDINAQINKNTDLLRVSSSGGLSAGEFFQFENDSKVYLVIDGGVGGNMIQFAPKLRKNVPGNTNLILGGRVTLQCSYDVDTRLGIMFKDGILSDPGSVKLVERI